MNAPRRKRAPKPNLVPSATAKDRAWLRHAAAVLGIWVLASAAYSNSFATGLAADAAMLLHDPRIAAADMRNVAAVFHEQYYISSTSGLYRPLATLSYLFNFAVLGNGLNPEGYHAVNFLLHAANILLVYLLGWLLFRSLPSAVLLAAIWGLHPVLTEAVTNIAGRPDLLAGFGVLGGLVAHIMARQSAGRARTAWIGVLAASCAVGLFSKESAIVLVVMMAMYDLGWRPPNWRSVIPSYAAALLPLGIFLLLRARALAGAPPNFTLYTDNPLIGADFWTARLTALGVIGRYLRILAWPALLSCDYSFYAVPLFSGFRSSSDWVVLAGLAVCLAGATAAAICYRRCREACFFLIFFAVALAPVSNLAILIGTDMAERFLYLPAVAFAAILVLGITGLARRAGRRVHRLMPVAAALLCCALAVRTYARNDDWRDERSLWESTVKSVPNNAKAHITLADILTDPSGRDLPRAAAEADRALAIVDALPDAQNIADDYATAGRVYRMMGESLPEGSAQSAWFHKALTTLLRGKRVDAALSEALRNSPAGKFYATLGQPDVYSELGRLYSRLGEPANAIEPLEHARRIRPGAPDDSDSTALAGAYYSMGQWKEAAVTLLEGQVLNPRNPVFNDGLQALYKERDPSGCELQSAGSSPQINFACPAVHQDVCTAFKRVIRLREARGETRLAVLATQSSAEFDCSAR